jgi:hypothetical protein
MRGVDTNNEISNFCKRNEIVTRLFGNNMSDNIQPRLHKIIANSPNVVVERLILLFRIREVPG